MGVRESVPRSHTGYRQGFCLPVSPTNAPGNQDPVEKAIFKYQYPALHPSYKPIYILMLKYYTSFFYFINAHTNRLQTQLQCDKFLLFHVYTIYGPLGLANAVT